jgi:hypothetical protein
MPALGFSVRAVEAADQLRLVCTFDNAYPVPVYAQNQYRSQRRSVATIGGGRSPNDPSDPHAPFSTASACIWPDDGALLVFQGEVSRPTSAPQGLWPSPGHTLLPLGESTFEIAIRMPAFQWENNWAPRASGPRIAARQINVCVELLLSPLKVHIIDGVSVCDFGQPGYVSAIVELETPVICVTDSQLSGRANEQRRVLGSAVCLAGVPLGTPPTARKPTVLIQPPRRKSRGSRIV